MASIQGVKYTYIVRIWSHEDKALVKRYVCLFEVNDYGKGLAEDGRVAKSLPKDALFVVDSFDRENVTNSCINGGDNGLGTFYLAYCVRFIQANLLLFWEIYKQHLPDQPIIETSLDKRDELRSKEKSIGRKQQDY